MAEKYKQFLRMFDYARRKVQGEANLHMTEFDSILQGLQDKEQEIKLCRDKVVALREKVRGTIKLVRSLTL